MLDLTLFPRQESWGTGDEALDNKLSSALRKSASHLSFDSIHEFYSLGIHLKPRTYNPSFLMTIELVAKALFHHLSPDECIDHSLKKMKGQYYSKKKLDFHFKDVDLILEELKTTGKCRYQGQIDFSVTFQNRTERNPFVRGEIKNSIMDLNTKIIFKEFKNYLKEGADDQLFSDPLFQALRGGKGLLVIENFAEIWYHQEQIFSISHLKSSLGS